MRFEENNTTKDLNMTSCSACNFTYKWLGEGNPPPKCPRCTLQDHTNKSCLQVQEGGSHYHQGTIQPIEYIHANDLNFFEGNAIKYVTRNRRKKSAVEDLKKAIHYIQLQLKLMHQIDSRIDYDSVPRD
jgi:hypothetical protein